MIFVTVGTHEQPFNRLVQKIDKLKEDGMIIEDVMIQTGLRYYSSQIKNLIAIGLKRKFKK
jgi:UDP-N-acetylglucosamine transferase subunit ALG13